MYLTVTQFEEPDVMDVFRLLLAHCMRPSAPATDDIRFWIAPDVSVLRCALSALASLCDRVVGVR